VGMRNYVSPSAEDQMLATAKLRIDGGGSWKRYSFSLTPQESTTCLEIPFGSDPDISCRLYGGHAATMNEGRGAVDQGEHGTVEQHWDVHENHACGVGSKKIAFNPNVPTLTACQAWCSSQPACTEFEWKNNAVADAQDGQNLSSSTPFAQNHWCALFNDSGATAPLPNPAYDCGCRNKCAASPAPRPGPNPPAPPDWRPAPGDACQRCGGELIIGLTQPGTTVYLDFAALHLPQDERFAGLEVRRDAVELLQSMGVTAIRQGGSFADASYYSWKNWRGQKWERPSFGEGVKTTFPCKAC
jgi:hypothetical protein